jgi:hypothetical protein
LGVLDHPVDECLAVLTSPKHGLVRILGLPVDPIDLANALHVVARHFPPTVREQLVQFRKQLLLPERVGAIGV